MSAGAGRRARRAAEQAAFETVYMLGGPDVAQEWADRGVPTNQLVRGKVDLSGRLVTEPVWRFRRFRCPRCHGWGEDPVQSPFSGDELDPCGFCHGKKLIEPYHYRIADMVLTARSREKRERRRDNAEDWLR